MLDDIPLGVWTDYLDWEGSLPSAMSLMEFDGYMAGLAVTPSFEPGGRWRAEVWRNGWPRSLYRRAAYANGARWAAALLQRCTDSYWHRHRLLQPTMPADRGRSRSGRGSHLGDRLHARDGV